MAYVREMSTCLRSFWSMAFLYQSIDRSINQNYTITSGLKEKIIYRLFVTLELNMRKYS